MKGGEGGIRGCIVISELQRSPTSSLQRSPTSKLTSSLHTSLLTTHRFNQPSLRSQYNVQIRRQHSEEDVKVVGIAAILSNQN